MKGVNPDIYRRSLEIMDEQSDAGGCADRLLALAARGRTAFRGVAAALEDRPGDPARDELALRGGSDGASVARVLRRALGREDEARRRSNPVARNEGFDCARCGAAVEAADRGVQRNHCPFCLYSLHVDDVPGDRVQTCGGLMAPVAVERVGGDRVVIRHRCLSCGAERRVRAALASSIQPDSPAAIAQLAAAVDPR